MGSCQLCLYFDRNHNMRVPILPKSVDMCLLQRHIALQITSIHNPTGRQDPYKFFKKSENGPKHILCLLFTLCMIFSHFTYELSGDLQSAAILNIVSSSARGSDLTGHKIIAM